MERVDQAFHKTKGTAFAVPPAYGVIIKLSRVETLFNQTSAVRIHENGSSFSSCNRRSGTEVAGVSVTLHQASSLGSVHMVSSPVSNSTVVGELLSGDAILLGQLKGIVQDSSSLLTGDGLLRLEGAVIITRDDAVLSAEVDSSLAPVVVSNVGESRFNIGIVIIAHGVGDHSGKLGTSGSASGIEGAVAHTGHIAIISSIHHVVMVPSILRNVGEGQANLDGDGVHMGGVTIFRSDIHLHRVGVVHGSNAALKGNVALGATHNQLRASGSSKLSNQAGHVGAVGHFHSDGALFGGAVHDLTGEVANGEGGDFSFFVGSSPGQIEGVGGNGGLSGIVQTILSLYVDLSIRNFTGSTICSPTFPPLTAIFSSCSAEASIAVGNSFFIPTGEQPPLM